MGRVLSIVAEKGGVSKTTLATNLATALHRAGESVLLVDCDPQHTAYSWAHLPGPDKPQTVVGEYRGLDRAVRDLRDKYRWIVIDNQPGAHAEMVQAIHAADFVLLPLRPGADLWATKSTAQLVREALAERPERRAAVVLTQELHGTVLGRAVWDKLEGLGIPVVPTRIEMRVAYGEALLTGQSVFDTNDRKAQHEVESLLTDITTIWDAN